MPTNGETRWRWIGAVSGVFLAVSMVCGCTSGAPQKTQAPKDDELRPAAEPGRAPPLSADPPGRILEIGSAPEGVVVDGPSRKVVVGVHDPDALAVVDADSGSITRRVPLPGHLRHLQLSAPGGPVLVPVENANQLLEFSTRTATVTSRVRTGSSPHDATSAADGTMFVANEGGHDLVAVQDGRVVRRFTDPPQPAGLAAVGNQVALVDVADRRLRFYDAEHLRRTARLPAGNGPTHQIADRHGRFVVTDTRGEAILLFAGGPRPHRVARLPLPGKPYGIAYDPTRDRVWVTLTARNELVGIDMAKQEPRVIARIPTVRQPNSVGVDPVRGKVWVTGTANGKLQEIDPD